MEPGIKGTYTNIHLLYYCIYNICLLLYSEFVLLYIILDEKEDTESSRTV